MALEIPNVAHAAGVAVAVITDPDPMAFVGTLELSAGQGFTDVNYLELAGEVSATGQRWTFANDIAADNAIVSGGGSVSAMGISIVGAPAQLPAGFPPEFFVEGSVLTEITPVAELDVPANIWCVVYSVPRNGEA